MPLDREDTLKKAEKLLRQGRLDAAIAEYVRVVEDQPRDWNTANTLGDLYVRANQSEKAVAQYARIAEHFFKDGFYPKAAALYKKILKFTPDDEQAQLNLGELSAKQGLLVDAKSYFQTVAGRRRKRGDLRGADEIVVRLGAVDPADIGARNAAARILEDTGDHKAAAARFRELYVDLAEKARDADALQALGEAVRLNPADVEGRAILARAAIAAGDLSAARGYLDRESAGEDATLLMALAGIELRAGELDRARELLAKLLALDARLRHDVVELGWALSGSSIAAAFVCVDAAIDASAAVNQFDEAASMLEEFVTRQPGHIPALLKLVEVCVDGGLEATMYDAQVQLADAYLSAGQGADARAIAEDLVAREPWEAGHIDRFRRALVMLRVSEPDTVIAERLSGQSPFTATDRFSAPPEPSAASDVKPALMVEVRPSEPPPYQAPAPGGPRTPPRSSPGSGEIDLSSALGDMGTSEAAPPASLADVFKGLRKDAGRADGADKSAQHMTLARTYLEMGMLEEATASLKTAAGSPRQRFEAASLLGRLYREHGDSAQAIEWLERAAEAPATGADEGRALLYDLGLALEEAGETPRALSVFLELMADAGEYRDVAGRADRLTRAQTGG